jgi:hypothetical protein
MGRIGSPVTRDGAKSLGVPENVVAVGSGTGQITPLKRREKHERVAGRGHPAGPSTTNTASRMPAPDGSSSTPARWEDYRCMRAFRSTYRLGGHVRPIATTGGVLLLLPSGCSDGGNSGGTRSYRLTVTYSVMTTDSNIQGLRVIYTDGSGSSSTIEASSSIWNQTVEFDRAVPTVVLTGQAAGGLTGVECIIQFHGKTVSQDTDRPRLAATTLPTG